MPYYQTQQNYVQPQSVMGLPKINELSIIKDEIYSCSEKQTNNILNRQCKISINRYGDLISEMVILLYCSDERFYHLLPQMIKHIEINIGGMPIVEMPFNYLICKNLKERKNIKDNLNNFYEQNLINKNGEMEIKINLKDYFTEHIPLTSLKYHEVMVIMNFQIYEDDTLYHENQELFKSMNDFKSFMLSTYTIDIMGRYLDIAPGIKKNKLLTAFYTFGTYKYENMKKTLQHQMNYPNFKNSIGIRLDNVPEIDVNVIGFSLDKDFDFNVNEKKSWVNKENCTNNDPQILMNLLMDGLDFIGSDIKLEDIYIKFKQPCRMMSGMLALSYSS
jgi:hypothetical protein